MAKTLHVADCLCLEAGYTFFEGKFIDKNFLSKCLKDLDLAPHCLPPLLAQLKERIDNMTEQGII
jgi:hypothetical protein